MHIGSFSRERINRHSKNSSILLPDLQSHNKANKDYTHYKSNNQSTFAGSSRVQDSEKLSYDIGKMRIFNLCGNTNKLKKLNNESDSKHTMSDLQISSVVMKEGNYYSIHNEQDPYSMKTNQTKRLDMKSINNLNFYDKNEKNITQDSKRNEQVNPIISPINNRNTTDNTLIRRNSNRSFYNLNIDPSVMHTDSRNFNASESRSLRNIKPINKLNLLTGVNDEKNHIPDKFGIESQIKYTKEKMENNEFYFANSSQVDLITQLRNYSEIEKKNKERLKQEVLKKQKSPMEIEFTKANEDFNQVQSKVNLNQKNFFQNTESYSFKKRIKYEFYKEDYNDTHPNSLKQNIPPWINQICQKLHTNYDERLVEDIFNPFYVSQTQKALRNSISKTAYEQLMKGSLAMYNTKYGLTRNNTILSSCHDSSYKGHSPSKTARNLGNSLFNNKSSYLTSSEYVAAERVLQALNHDTQENLRQNFQEYLEKRRCCEQSALTANVTNIKRGQFNKDNKFFSAMNKMLNIGSALKKSTGNFYSCRPSLNLESPLLKPVNNLIPRKTLETVESEQFSLQEKIEIQHSEDSLDGEVGIGGKINTNTYSKEFIEWLEKEKQLIRSNDHYRTLISHGKHLDILLKKLDEKSVEDADFVNKHVSPENWEKFNTMKNKKGMQPSVLDFEKVKEKHSEHNVEETDSELESSDGLRSSQEKTADLKAKNYDEKPILDLKSIHQEADFQISQMDNQIEEKLPEEKISPKVYSPEKMIKIKSFSNLEQSTYAKNAFINEENNDSLDPNKTNYKRNFNKLKDSNVNVVKCSKGNVYDIEQIDISTFDKLGFNDGRICQATSSKICASEGIGSNLNCCVLNNNQLKFQNKWGNMTDKFIKSVGIITQGVGRDKHKVSKFICKEFEQIWYRFRHFKKGEFLKQFKKISEFQAMKLMSNKNLDAVLSGAMVTFYLIKNNILYIGNLGTQKLYVIYKKSEYQWRFNKLSTKHNWLDPNEIKRLDPNGFVKSDNKHYLSALDKEEFNEENNQMSTRYLGQFSGLQYGFNWEADYKAVEQKKQDKIIFQCNDDMFQLSSPEIIINRICSLYMKYDVKEATERFDQQLKTRVGELNLKNIEICYSLNFMNIPEGVQEKPMNLNFPVELTKMNKYKTPKNRKLN